MFPTVLLRESWIPSIFSSPVSFDLFKPSITVWKALVSMYFTNIVGWLIVQTYPSRHRTYGSLCYMKDRDLRPTNGGSCRWMQLLFWPTPWWIRTVVNGSELVGLVTVFCIVLISDSKHIDRRLGLVIRSYALQWKPRGSLCMNMLACTPSSSSQSRLIISSRLITESHSMHLPSYLYLECVRLLPGWKRAMMPQKRPVSSDDITRHRA